MLFLSFLLSLRKKGTKVSFVNMEMQPNAMKRRIVGR